jgi:hypothetical protein
MIRRAGLALLLAAGCTPVPRPGVLEEVDRTRTAAAAKEASVEAPQASLYAEQLRRDAERAFRDGDRPTAEFLGEHALAAYAHAAVLARLASADKRLTAATRELDRAQAEFAALDDQQRRLAAEADDVETRVRVARDALPLAVSEPATAEREHARLAAAKALSVDARLLCVATALLGPDTPGVAAAFKSLDALDAEIVRAATAGSAPIDAAVRLRSACLAELTAARRPRTSQAPEAGIADALLAELGSSGLEPRRDDRGVAVVLRDLFQGAALKPEGRQRLAALGQVARAHEGFPVLVVVHGPRGPATPRDRARAELVAATLTEAGAPHVASRAVGDALPVALPRRADSAQKNERMEIVFVAPAL